MKKLQVPYNLDRKSVSLYCAWSEYIAEIYFMAPREVFGSARQYQEYPSYEDYLLQVQNICYMCNRFHINSMMLFNGNDDLTSSTIDKIIDLLNICKKWDMTGVIVANPILGEIIHSYFPDLKIRYSILSLASTMGKIKEIEKLGYIKEICLPQDVNRNEDFLKEITKECPDIGFSTIVNVSCRANCPLFYWHQMYFSTTNRHSLNDVENHDWRRGQLELTNKFTDNNLCIPTILPSELKYYDKYFSQFKLEDRLAKTETLEQFLIHYALEIDPIYYSQMSNSTCARFDPGKIRISEAPSYWKEYRRNCKNQCWKCHLCEDVLPTILDD